jgi:hypothetical protein
MFTKVYAKFLFESPPVIPPFIYVSGFLSLLKKNDNKNYRLGKWEALKGHNYLSATVGSITAVNLPNLLD